MMKIPSKLFFQEMRALAVNIAVEFTQYDNSNVYDVVIMPSGSLKVVFNFKNEDNVLEYDDYEVTNVHMKAYFNVKQRESIQAGNPADKESTNKNFLPTHNRSLYRRLSNDVDDA